MSKLFKQRKNELHKLLADKRLDLILMYSTSLDSRYSKWIAGVTAPAFHYYFIDSNKTGFCEVNYFAAELRSKTDEEVIELEDNTIGAQLQNLFNNYSSIGIVGEVPYTHLIELQKNAQIIDVTAEIDQLLLIKSADEIIQIKAAATVLKNVFAEANKLLRPNISTKEISLSINTHLRANADELAFSTSVATSKHLPESTIATPDNTLIKLQDSICIDMGVIKDGFYADATRMFFIGNKEQENSYNKLVEVNNEVIRWIVAGRTLKELVDKYKIELKKAGLPLTLEKTELGHAIGFGLHEYPNFYKDNLENFVLQDSMVITLEPEIVFTEYRIRVENMVLIKNENSEILV